MKLTKIQQARWDNAKRLAQSIKDTAQKNNCDFLFLDTLTPIECLKITENSIFIRHCSTTHSLFILDPNVDEGLEMKKDDYTKWFKDNLKLYKEFNYD